MRSMTISSFWQGSSFFEYSPFPSRKIKHSEVVVHFVAHPTIEVQFLKKRQINGKYYKNIWNSYLIISMH